MADQVVPKWEDDPLSAYFFAAEFNTRVTALNFSKAYLLIRQINDLFRNLQTASTPGAEGELLVSQFLLVRSYAAFLGGVRLCMSGQTVESCPVLRSAVESAWYALHLAKDPLPPKRLHLWFNRNDSESGKKSSKQEFTVANVRKTHEALDPFMAGALFQVYELLIDFGAHPNQYGVMNSLKVEQDDKTRTYQVGILHPESDTLLFGLKVAVDVAVGVLAVFGLIYPEEFKSLGVDVALKQVIPAAHQLFRTSS